MTDVVWKLERHTGAKHSILRRYLDAWFPILASWAGRLVFIDGFAGPGEYVGSEPGSPIIALRAATEHKRDLSSCELDFLFVEENAERARHLEALIRTMNLPSNVKWEVKPGEFAKVVAEVLDVVEGKPARLAPAFVMVDPFGFSGIPMRLLHRLARHPRSELLISFMYESVNRFLGKHELEATFDELFGSSGWREALRITAPSERKDFLIELYMRQLQEGGMTHVRAFEMIDSGNRTEYFLIHATKSREGVRVMKAAMWKEDPIGGLLFADTTNPNQMTLISREPDYGQLKRIILDRFHGQEFTVQELEDFVLLQTAYRETHYKKQILTPLEKARELEVLWSPRKQRFRYPPGTVIKLP